MIRENKMNKITLNAREIDKLYQLFIKMNESSEYGNVTLTTEGDNGIGSVLTATFVVTHKGVEGDFTVTITDESDW
jgi:hypothetical protein